MPSVLLTTDKFAPHAGGSAVVYTEWCKRWPAERVRVITREYPGGAEFDAKQAFGVVRVPYLDIPKVRMPLLWLRLFLATLREFRVHRPDVFHCGQVLDVGGYAPWMKRRFGVPYVVHLHGEELAHFVRRPSSERRLRTVLAAASGAWCNSHFTERLLRECLGYAGCLVLAHPGVDTDRFVPGDGAGIRRRLGLDDGPMLLTVARLMRRKGHDRVLEALPIVARRIADVQYVVAGTGPDEARLRRLVGSSPVRERVRILGRVTDDDLVPLMQTADVFIHPNRELPNGDVEGFGIVFLEANSCGVPVIGGNSGGTPDAIRDGETGFLVDPNNVEEIAERTIRLLEDRSLRERMGRAGREWARQFSWDDAARKVWELTERVAHAR